MSENKPRRRAQAARAAKKSASRKSGLSRVMLVAMMMVMVAVVSIGGTLAWLQDETGTIVNTFTTSNINIELTETDAAVDGNLLTNSYKMVPNVDISKDPKATVKANSEACYLFVKVVETAPTFKGDENLSDDQKTFDAFLSYAPADGWTKLEGEGVPTTVYYRTVESSTSDQTFSVLKGDKVHAQENITKPMMDDLATLPKLTFTAYAIQKADGTNENGFEPLAAWNAISK